MTIHRLDRYAAAILPFFLWTVRLAFGAAVLLSLIRFAPTKLFFAVAGFVCSFYPLLLKKTSLVILPASIQILMVLDFLVAAALAGSVFKVYERLFWWDDFIHFWAGFLFFLAAYVNLQILQVKGRIRAGRNFLLFFAASIGLALEALWEVIELIAVFFTGMKLGAMQLSDTPIDIADNFFGILLGIALVLLYEKKQGSPHHPGH